MGEPILVEETVMVVKAKPVKRVGSGYHHMSKAERSEFFETRHVRENLRPRDRYRCVRCRAVIEDREMGRHAGTCWADAILDWFTKV